MSKNETNIIQKDEAYEIPRDATVSVDFFKKPTDWGEELIELRFIINGEKRAIAFSSAYGLWNTLHIGRNNSIRP